MRVIPKHIDCEAVQYLGENFKEVALLAEFYGGDSTRNATYQLRDGEVEILHDSVSIQIWSRTYRAESGEWVIFDPENKVVRAMDEDKFGRYYEEGE